MAQDTAQATQCTEWAQRRTGAKWLRILQTQHNTPCEHTGEQKPSGLGHHTHSTTHRACAPLSRSKVVHDTAHTTHRTQGAHL